MQLLLWFHSLCTSTDNPISNHHLFLKYGLVAWYYMEFPTISMVVIQHSQHDPYHNSDTNWMAISGCIRSAVRGRAACIDLGCGQSGFHSEISSWPAPSVQDYGTDLETWLCGRLTESGGSLLYTLWRFWTYQSFVQSCFCSEMLTSQLNHIIMRGVLLVQLLFCHDVVQPYTQEE